MKGILAVLCLFACVKAANWAVLVAGSNTWANYRHQADVFHAYKSLYSKGISKDHIITLAFDDIASYSRNPFPGKVFNKPSYNQPGQDVYSGVVIDYKGKDVTPKNFLAVLQGDENAVKGIGSGRVLKTGPSDNIIIFFSDHGAPGLIAFPTQYLYADALIGSFAKMNGKYAKIVFYLQSCESGSMFVKLPTNTKIYALSAANPSQSSWGTYCSPDDTIQGKHIGSCLGDLFSVKLFEDMDVDDLSVETLASQFAKIKMQTTLSHVTQWGDLSFQSDTVDTYTAKNNNNLKIQPIISKFRLPSAKVDSRFNKVVLLSQAYARQPTEQVFAELRQEMNNMQYHDNIFHKFSHQLGLDGVYNPEAIEFDCLRTMMHTYETKCMKFSDYALIYVKYFAQACQSHPASYLIHHIDC